MDNTKMFLGHKLVKATPMTLLEYNTYRGWELPSNEDGSEDGFLVEYIDGGKPNHPDHESYISWSPVDVFNNSYHASGNLNFGDALELLKRGFKVSRSGWNGKNMFVFLTPGREIPNARMRSFANFDGESVKLVEHIDMKAADGSYVIGWLASQTDMLAEDWGVVE